MKQLLLGLVVSLLLVGQAAAWFPKLPCSSSPSFSSPCAQGGMRHQRPCRGSYLQPLAASSWQGEGKSSNRSPPKPQKQKQTKQKKLYEVPNTTLFDEHEREKSRRMEDKTDRTLGKESGSHKWVKAMSWEGEGGRRRGTLLRVSGVGVSVAYVVPPHA